MVTVIIETIAIQTCKQLNQMVECEVRTATERTRLLLQCLSSHVISSTHVLLTVPIESTSFDQLGGGTVW